MIFDKLQKNEQDLVSVCTTCASREEAKSIAFSVVEEKLAACADFWPISSIYPWQEVVQEVDQYMLVVTTQRPFSEKLIKFITGLHSYSIPFVAEYEVKNASLLYKTWVDETLHGNKEYITEYEKKIRDVSKEEGVYHPGKLK